MSQKPQSSSNETHYSFAAAPAAINDTPGSVESGGGGTVSYVGTRCERLNYSYDRERSMRRSPLSHGRNVRTLMCGDRTSFKPFVLLLVILTQQHGGAGLHLLNYLILIMHCCPTQVNSDSNLLTASCRWFCRTCLMLRAKSHVR